jgi:hypothetical protein
MVAHLYFFNALPTAKNPKEPPRKRKNKTEKYFNYTSTNKIALLVTRA